MVKGPHSSFDRVYLWAGTGKFSMKTIFKSWFLRNIWLQKLHKKIIYLLFLRVCDQDHRRPHGPV